METQTVVLRNPSGLHARPAASFSQTAKQFKSKVRIDANGRTVNGRSVVSILTAGIGTNTEIVLSTDGEDEKEALAALVALVESGCGE